MVALKIYTKNKSRKKNKNKIKDIFQSKLFYQLSITASILNMGAICEDKRHLDVKNSNIFIRMIIFLKEYFLIEFLAFHTFQITHSKLQIKIEQNA